MVWQMDLSRELMGLHDSLDDHVNPDEAAAKLIELAHDLRASTTLEGEEAERGPNVAIANAAEFAWTWNLATPEQRETIVAVLMARQDEAMRCFMEDHDGLKEQLEVSSRRIAELSSPQPVVTDDQLGIMAQRFYEACRDILVMQMTEKVLIVEGLRAAMLSIGYTLPKANSWKTEYGHEDCEQCEALAELAIVYLSAAGNEHLVTKHLPGTYDGHWGRATRSS